MTSFTNHPLETLEALVASLVGQVCWSATCGGAAGSNLMLDLGRDVPRKHPVPNRRLSDRQRHFEGEFRVFINCAWRLERGSVLVCGSGDDSDPNGPMVTSTEQVQGSVVEHAEIQGGAHDLTLRFVEGWVLRVFCDQIDVDESRMNYSITAGEVTVAVV
jgi:hypothetical protein